MKCLKCGHASPVPQKFCGECGARLESVEAKSPSFAERNYTPPHLAEKILRSRSALEGERKSVIVLFCDITNSTPLAERIGPDRMHKMVRITRDHVEYKSIGLRALKGKSEPIAVHELIREHGHRARAGASADATLAEARIFLERGRRTVFPRIYRRRYISSVNVTRSANVARERR